VYFFYFNAYSYYLQSYFYLLEKNNYTKEKNNMDVYQIVTDRIIEQLEQGYIPWQKPWLTFRQGAFNRVTKRPYSILNQMLLNKEGEWATFNNLLSKKGKDNVKNEILGVLKHDYVYCMHPNYIGDGTFKIYASD
jgi:hypothetical protein